MLSHVATPGAAFSKVGVETKPDYAAQNAEGETFFGVDAKGKPVPGCGTIPPVHVRVDE